MLNSELDLVNLGKVHKRLKSRRSSRRASHRCCSCARDRVLYFDRCRPDSGSNGIADPEPHRTAFGDTEPTTDVIADSGPQHGPVAPADSAADGLRSWLLVELDLVLGHMRRRRFISRAQRAETNRW